MAFLAKASGLAYGFRRGIAESYRKRIPTLTPNTGSFGTGHETRARILLATAAVLRPGGEFRTFGYHCGLLMRGAWHFRGAVERLFSEVTISEVVWMNMPPAFVYRCVR